MPRYEHIAIFRKVFGETEHMWAERRKRNGQAKKWPRPETERSGEEVWKIALEPERFEFPVPSPLQKSKTSL